MKTIRVMYILMENINRTSGNNKVRPPKIRSNKRNEKSKIKKYV